MVHAVGCGHDHLVLARGQLALIGGRPQRLAVHLHRGPLLVRRDLDLALEILTHLLQQRQDGGFDLQLVRIHQRVVSQRCLEGLLGLLHLPQHPMVEAHVEVDLCQGLGRRRLLAGLVEDLLGFGEASHLVVQDPLL